VPIVPIVTIACSNRKVDSPLHATTSAPEGGAVAPLGLAELEQLALQRNPTLVQAAARIGIS
jgi:hypothetical protein